MVKETIVIGKYNREASINEAFNIVDDYNMHGFIDNMYHGDSLGGGFRMFYCYDDEIFVNSAKKMWYWSFDRKTYIGQRHPLISPKKHSMSRDHYKSTLMTLKLHHMRTGYMPSMAKIKYITDNTGYIISSMARRTLALKAWSKAIQGDKKAEKIYYILSILTAAIIYRPIHKFLSWVVNYGEEVDQNKYNLHPILQELPKYKQIISKVILPSYSIRQVGWMLYMLDDSKWKKIMQKIYLPMIGKTNYVQQMLFGKKDIPRKKIESFKPMKGGRWSGYLNSRNDRNMQILNPTPKFNNVDKDMAIKLFNETQI